MIVDELIALLGFQTKGQDELRRFNDGLDNAERKAQAVATRINAMSVAIGTFVGQMAVDFARGIGSTIGSLPGDVLAVGKEFENLGIRFETLEGSVEKGKAALEWVRQFAVDTPLDLAQAANAYARLKNFGIDPANGSLLAMVDAMAASGQGLQMLERLTLATGQAWAKGKLQGEEILQLVEAGIPVWEMLEKATGKSAAELQKLSSAGKLGRDVIQQLIDEIGKKYVGASEKMAKTLDGIQDKITEAWTNFKKEVADRGFYDEFKRRSQGVLDTLEGWEKSGALGRAAGAVSRFLTGSMYFAERVGRVLWDIGKAAYYSATGITDLISRVTGLNSAASAGVLGAAIVGSTATGRALMLALAKKLPAMGAFLLIEDIMSGLRGDDSYIASLEGGQEALDKIRKSSSDLASAIRELTSAFDGLLDFDFEGFSWGSFINEELVRFVRELNAEIESLANKIRWLKENVIDPVREKTADYLSGGGIREPAPNTPADLLNRFSGGRLLGNYSTGKGDRLPEPHASRFEPGRAQVSGMDELRTALEFFNANSAKLASSSEAVMNDNRVQTDSRDQSQHVSVGGVTVNVQQATQAPGAVGQAVGNAVGQAAVAPRAQLNTEPSF